MSTDLSSSFNPSLVAACLLILAHFKMQISPTPPSPLPKPKAIGLTQPVSLCRNPTGSFTRCVQDNEQTTVNIVIQLVPSNTREGDNRKQATVEGFCLKRNESLVENERGLGKDSRFTPSNLAVHCSLAPVCVCLSTRIISNCKWRKFSPKKNPLASAKSASRIQKIHRSKEAEKHSRMAIKLIKVH